MDIKKQAFNLVREEVKQWEDALVPITPKVFFKMRSLIETLRKNYWGVFDEAIDPITGRKKIWIPLTESIVDAVVKNIDVDQKDVNFRAKNPQGRAITDFVRAYVKDYLDSLYFGEILDADERSLAIDGTIVWKTIKGPKGKLERFTTDLLNIYIDPTANNCQDAIRITERSLMTPADIASMDGWLDTDDIQGKANLPNTSVERMLSMRTTTTAKQQDVYEMWGLIPKSLITGNEEDNEEVEGRIVISGIETGDHRVHLIEENKSGIRPYEACVYSKVSGRFYGRGVAEKVMMLQLWMNTLVNIRINRSYVSQLGLFKIRRGSGITPQMLSRLPANGAVSVTNMDDIEQMVVTEASQASYTDEDNIMGWATRLTSAFEVVTGEGLPSSTPATNAVIQDRNAKSQFTMVKEQIGIFLQRWMDRHVLPILGEKIKTEDIIRVSGDDDLVKRLVERVTSHIANEKLDLIESVLSERAFNSVEEIEDVMRDVSNFQKKVADAEQRLRNEPELFLETIKDIVIKNIDTKVYITNEELDISVAVQNAINMANIAPEYRVQLIQEAADLMGLQLKEPQQPTQLPQQGPVEQFDSQSLQELATSANVPSLNV